MPINKGHVYQVKYMEENMKKLLVTSLALGVAGIAANATAAIINTAHDIPLYNAGAYAGGPSSTEPCAYCHTPHGAYWNVGAGITNDFQAPLWDHQTTVSSFVMYTDPFGTIDATDLPTGTTQLPDGVSKACMSCHDGIVAVDAYHQVAGTKVIATTDTANLGTDLSNDHPVSFSYGPAAANDAELQPIGNVGDLLLNNKVECGSCHDVHNAGFGSFLVQTNVASALCKRCHIK